MANFPKNKDAGQKNADDQGPDFFRREQIPPVRRLQGGFGRRCEKNKAHRTELCVQKAAQGGGSQQPQRSPEQATLPSPADASHGRNGDQAHQKIPIRSQRQYADTAGDSKRPGSSGKHGRACKPGNDGGPAVMGRSKCPNKNRHSVGSNDRQAEKGRPGAYGKFYGAVPSPPFDEQEHGKRKQGCHSNPMREKRQRRVFGGRVNR